MKLLLDTNAVLYYLQDSMPEIGGSPARMAVSIVSEIELLGFHGLSTEEERSIRGFLSVAKILPLDHPTKEEAITLRRLYRLKTADAIIAATAKMWGATLVTNDEKLLQLPAIQTLRFRLLR